MTPFQARNLVTVLILATLATFSPFSLDLDAMRLMLPDMMIDLHGTAAKVLLGAYGAALLASQALFAPVLNRFGTQTPFYAGLAVFILASLGGVALGAPEARLAFRLLQALGGLAAQAAAMTMARGFFTPGRDAREFTILILLLGAASTLLPGAGVAAAARMGWQWALVLPATALLAALEKAAQRIQASAAAAGAPAASVEVLPAMMVTERKPAAAAQPSLRRRTAIPANSQYAYLPACRAGTC